MAYEVLPVSSDVMRAFVGALALVLLAACSSSAKSAEPPAATASTSTTIPADCTPARPAPQPFEEYTSRKGRSYSLTLPKDYDGTNAVPVIFGFHGAGASKELFKIDTQLAEKGAAAGYAVVLVDSEGTPTNWRIFDFDGPGTDYSEITALVEELEQTLCIDERRVFATGHSAGSAFAGFLVCRKPYLFAGVAMVSATIPNLCPDDVAVANLGIHGAKDPVVLYDGGKGLGQQAGIPPFRETIAKTAAKNGCKADPPIEHPQPGVDRLAFTNCDVPVEGITIVGGGHPWPGGFQATHTKPVPEGATFDATGAILDFFDAAG